MSSTLEPVTQKLPYAASAALSFLGLSLTQWATVVGIVGTLAGILLAYLTYKINKRSKEEHLKMDREEHHKRMSVLRKRDQDLE